MNCKQRFLAMLLALCTVFSVLAPAASAAAPTKMTVANIASGSAKVAQDLQAAIKSGKADGSGIYADVVVPSAFALGAYTMDIADYTLMAAQAIRAINDGLAATTEIYYMDVSLTKDIAQGAKGTSVPSGTVLYLAERVQKYAAVEGKLPTSFNRPTDGSTTYEGRICILSVAHIFAQALSYYATNKKLPTSVTFLPTGYTTSKTTNPITPGVTEPPVTEPPATEPPANDMYADVLKAAADLVAYVDKNEAMPSSVKVGTKTYGIGTFEHMIALAIININSGITSGTLEVLDMEEAANPSETMSKGTIALTEYVDMANRTVNWNREQLLTANYTSTSLGKMHYYCRVYFFSAILASYKTNGKLPASVTISTWATLTGFTAGNATFGQDFSSYSRYLVPTANCQSTNATLMSVAKTGMVYGGNPSNTYQAMKNLFNYLNDKTTYDYYANTHRGAYGVWRDKAGNCCDMAHLMIACARSLGVPGRYRHGYCHFSSMSTGHVWADVFCGKQFASYDNYNSDGWLTADLVSYYNYLGYKTNRTSYFYGSDKCAELPF